MVYQSVKKSDPDGEVSDSGEINRCVDCGASRTPLWRSGPMGPKTLCNACGIKSRKKRRAVLGLKKCEEKKSRGNGTTTTTTTSSLHQRLIALGREVMGQRQRSTPGNRPRRMMQLGEEEQAAVLLMALSYGSVYA